MKRATALLYGLQLAAMNCRNLSATRPEANKVLRQLVECDGETIARPGLKNSQRWNYDADDAEDLAALALQDCGKGPAE